MELTLKKVKEKFEYINFEEEDIIECLNKAIEKCKKENQDNEISLKLSINDYFIRELIPLISSGREDILIAIQFAYEYELEFFMRKRNIKEKNKKLMNDYEISIVNALLNTEKGNFTSKLINNLIKLQRQQEEEMITMNYEIKDKNLYEIFSDYDEEFINMILSTMKKREERTYLKLVSIFGPNFDKKIIITEISYFQRQELNNKLNWFESKLKLTKKLISKGKKLAEVKEILTKQSDTIIIKMMSDEQESIQTFRNKQEIIDYYKISKKELDDSIVFLDNKEAIMAFKYAFGIGVQLLSKKEIMNKMNISDIKYNELIDYVFKNLEQAIKEYRDYINSFNSEKNKKKKEQKIEPINKQKKTFYDGLLDNVSEEQKENIKNMIRNNIHQSKSDVAKNIIALYGEDLETLNEDIILTKKELQNIRTYKYLIKKKIETGKLKIKEKKIPSTKKAKKNISFFESVFDETLTEQDKDEYKKIIIELVNSSNSVVAKNIIKLYGENLDEYNDSINLNKNERMNINCYKSSLRKKISEGKLVKKPKVKENKQNNSNNKIFEKNKYFLYRIVPQDTTTEELNIISEILYRIIPEFNEYMGYEIAKTLYGNDLKETFKKRKLSSTEKGQFYFFIKKLKKRIEMDKNNSIIIEENEGIKPTIVEVIKKQKSNQEPSEIDIQPKKEESKTQIQLDYIEELIYSLYVNEKCEPIVISRIICFTVEEIVSILIKMYPVLPNKTELVDYIAVNHPEKIKELLNIEFIKKGLYNCTNNELKVIYLKLLSKSNPLITDSYIAKLTGLEEETIKNYKLMTKEDSINELGELIMKKKKTNEI